MTSGVHYQNADGLHPWTRRSAGGLIGSARLRYRHYTTFALILFVAAWVAVSFKEHWTLIVSDGAGYYAYLPSILLDHDLDMANQFAAQRGEESPYSTPSTQALANKYPIGMALTLLPAFLLAQGLSHFFVSLTSAQAMSPAGYSLIHQALALAEILGLVVLMLVMTDKIMTERFKVSAKNAFCATVLVWLGSPFLYYSFREPFMVHMVSAFWVTTVAYTSHKLCLVRHHQASPTHPALILLPCLSMALVCRPTNLIAVAFLLCLAAQNLKNRAMAGFLRANGFWLAVGAMLALIPLLIQSIAWKVMFGRWIYYSYGGERFYWLDPALWQTLVSHRHGFFSWTPLFLFSFAGIFVVLRRRRENWLIAGLIAFGLLWYCNSCWYAWWFGDAFGARAFLELSCLYIVGLGCFLDYAETLSKGWKRFLLSAICSSVIFSMLLMILYILHLIPRG